MELRKDYLPFGKPNFSDEEVAAVARVLRSGWVGMGPETLAFEEELAAYVGVPHVVTVNSCTSALFLALLVSGVGPGDEVICPSLTWCATANVALYLGAKPVFCDVAPDTFCVTPELVKAKLSTKTKAVIVVHFGGLAVDVAQLRAALPASVAIIEDAAHALGSRYPDGKPVGSSGNLVCFSFYANKNLSTGEGGALAVCDDDLAERIRSLRQNGAPVDAWKRFSHPASILYTNLTELGYKMNYTDLQAGLGRVQLKRQTEFQAARLSVAQCYYEQLSTSTPAVCFQTAVLSSHHARHLFAVLLPLEQLAVSRNDLLLELRAKNVGASIHYAPLHKMPLYGASEPLANTDYVGERIITLPISASMNLADANYAAACVRDSLRRAEQAKQKSSNLKARRGH